MQTGAFALIDCLGFKDIWRNHPNPSAIIGNLKDIKKNSDQIIKRGLGSRWAVENFAVGLAFISDTVAVSVGYPAEKPISQDSPGVFLFAAGGLISEIVDQFSRGDPPLVLRGCMSYGEFMAEDNFFLGPAVDEVAEMMDLADGALVWLTPSAERIYDPFESRVKAAIQASADSVEDPLKAIREHMSFVGPLPNGAEFMKNYENSSEEKKETARQMLREALKTIGGEGPFVANYPVPLKGGRRFQTRVVNPLHGKPVDEVDKLVDRMMVAMDRDRLDVRIKRQNTQEYLRHAAEQSRLFSRKVNEAYLRVLSSSGKDISGVGK